jgi:transposase InsO family protein
MTASTHPSSTFKATSPLQYTYSDVMGPLDVGSNGARYWVTLLDDHSGASCGSAVKDRSEVAGALKQLMLLMEAKSASKGIIQNIRTDNGREFWGAAFEHWLLDRKTQHHTTAPYLHQQAGHAERLNRTLCDKVRSMLVDAGLSSKY